MGEIELRPIVRADVRSLSRVLARAFYTDPVMNYMLPDDKARAKALPPMFATLTRNHFIARGGSEVASRDGVIGAAEFRFNEAKLLGHAVGMDVDTQSVRQGEAVVGNGHLLHQVGDRNRSWLLRRGGSRDQGDG